MLLIAAAPAAGATRYAEPGGTGPAGTCPQSDPCDIQTAVEHFSVMPGDVVNLLPGTYSLGTDSVYVGIAITVQGAPGEPSPLLRSTTESALILAADNAVAQDLRVEATAQDAAETAVYTDADVLVQRLEVIASGTTGWGVVLRQGALLRDSFVWNSVANGYAIVTGTGSADLRNVTAIATGTGSYGIYTDSNFGPDTVPMDVTIRNSIIRGTTDGIRIEDADASGDDDIDYGVSYSSFSSSSDEPPDAVITLGAGNQTGAGTDPLLANEMAGDLHQLLGSPTIDAGSPDAATGPLDLDRQPRTMRGALDIGADELPDSCGGKLATIVGTSAADVLRGTSAADVIVGLGGSDLIKGLGGNDRLCGMKGRDRLRGGAGRDRLFGGPGRDRLSGGPGRDILRGGAGRDAMAQSAGADNEALVSYRTSGRLRFGRRTADPACATACLVWRFACSVDCSVKATSRIVLPGADVVTRTPGSYAAAQVGTIVIRPNRATRRRINRNFAQVKLKTKLKALGNSSSDTDTDTRVYRLKR